MVKARKERRWARVATAVALCLPCSSFVIPLHAADIAQAKSSLASLPPMRTQSQLNREVQPVQRTVSHSAASSRSLPAMRTQSQYVSTQKAMPTQATARPERYASAPTAREFAPAPSKPAESRAALKKNADFFPPVTEYYKPDPAYAGVRRDGSARQAISGMSQGYRAGSQDSLVFLRSMVARALAYSPELRAASAEVMASDYMVDQVKGQRMPQVRLGVTLSLIHI